MRTRNARWPRRASAAFAGRAKAVDKQVDAAATPLAKKLDSIRDAIGTSIFGATAKANTSSDVEALTPVEYATIEAAIDKIEAKKYAEAIYDDGEELVETSFNDARDLLSLETGFDVVPTWAIDELRSHAEDIANLIADRDRKALTQALEHALATGMSAKDTATALKDVFSAGITVFDDHGIAQSVQKTDSYFETVARTELQRASNLGQFALYEAGGIKSVRWQAAEPCFPAETPIATSVGDVPINQLSAGDDVLVPGGSARVRAVSVRMHRGELALIRAGEFALLATDNHPCFVTQSEWSDVGQWMAAGDVRPGNLVHTIDDKRVEVEAVIHLILPETDDDPSQARQIRVAATVLNGFAMPVGAVDLDCDSLLWKRKVDGPSPDSVFGREDDLKPLQGFSHRYLEPRSRVGTTVASKAAVSSTVSHVDRRAAGGALSDPRRSVATLGAETRTSDSPRLHEKIASAARALDLDARIVGSPLSDHRGSMAYLGTKAIWAGGTPQVSALEPLAALLAVADEGHLRIIHRYANERGISVYNIETTPDHVYFASGLLVHNCDECAEADNQVLPLGDVFPGVDVDMPPAHPRCRCVLIPSDDDLGDFGGTDEDRAAARRGNQPDDDEES